MLTFGIEKNSLNPVNHAALAPRQGRWYTYVKLASNEVLLLTSFVLHFQRFMVNASGLCQNLEEKDAAKKVHSQKSLTYGERDRE